MSIDPDCGAEWDRLPPSTCPNWQKHIDHLVKAQVIVSVPDEIIERLWIGDIANALAVHGKEGWVNVNVAHEHLMKLPGAYYLPFMLPGPMGLEINKFLLDAAADVIEAELAKGKSVMVNCNMGMERSPLAVVWFLHRKKGLSIDEAYRVVMSKRAVWDRREWLQPILVGQRWPFD